MKKITLNHSGLSVVIETDGDITPDMVTAATKIAASMRPPKADSGTLLREASLPLGRMEQSKSRVYPPPPPIYLDKTKRSESPVATCRK